jgi:hypothetical protein
VEGADFSNELRRVVHPRAGGYTIEHLAPDWVLSFDVTVPKAAKAGAKPHVRLRRDLMTNCPLSAFFNRNPTFRIR